MKRTRSTLLAKIAIFAFALPAITYATSDLMAPGYSGAPGETTCSNCHTNSDNNGNGNGWLRVTFSGALAYTANSKMHLVVKIHDPGKQRWGFQLTVRQWSSTNVSEGTLSAGSDGNTQTLCSDSSFVTYSFTTAACTTSTSATAQSLQYIEHTLTGTQAGVLNDASYQFDWTAPSSDVGTLVIYVSAVAADGDGTDAGDDSFVQRYWLNSPTSTAPTISDNGALNSATFQGGISPGSWFVIQGSDMANSSRGWYPDEVANGTLPTSLDGVTVTIDGHTAYLSYVSPGEIQGQVPADSNSGAVNVLVNNSGLVSNTGTATMEPVNPTFFLWLAKWIVATHLDYSYVGPSKMFNSVVTTPAKPGEVVVLWGNGFGPTSPPVPPGMVVPFDQIYYVANEPDIWIANEQVTPLGIALAPGLAGLYQVAVQIPDDVPTGDLPVVMQIGDYRSPPGVVVSVQR